MCRPLTLKNLVLQVTSTLSTASTYRGGFLVIGQIYRKWNLSQPARHILRRNKNHLLEGIFGLTVKSFFFEVLFYKLPYSHVGLMAANR
jgi:hypothetical protein